MSEPKKLTGLQKPLDISPALAKIIGTKKGEKISRPQVSCQISGLCLYFTFSVLVHQASLGLPQGEGPPGSPEQAVVHPQRHHGTHLRNREDQVFQHVQVPEGPPHQPRQINEEPDQSDIANYSDFNFPIFDLIN